MFDQLKLVLGLIVAVALFALGGVAGYKIEASKVAELKLQYAQSEVKAREEAASIQKAQDDIALGAAQTEASLQQAQVSLTERQIDEIKVHVSPSLVLATGSNGRSCIPLGFIRMLDAAALGLDPADLRLPTSSSDDSCSAVDAATLARNIISNYDGARENAEQLNRLEMTILELKSTTERQPRGLRSEDPHLP